MSADEPFVLDLATNPHPRMFQGAQEARAAAVIARKNRGTPAAHYAVGYWRGYRQAMADATGCDTWDIEAWMDRQ